MVQFPESAFRLGIGFLPLWSNKPKVQALQGVANRLIEKRKAQGNETTIEKLVKLSIQTFRWEHLKEIKGEWFVERKREKTKHQNRFSGCWYVWPETKALLDKFAAPKDNGHGLVLLDDGEPVSSRQISYTMFGNDGGSRFKDFRKTGATSMENNVGVEVSRLYKANAQGATEKLYVQQSYLKLTAALKQWRDELTTQKVI